MKKKQWNGFIIILLTGMLVGFGSFAMAGSNRGYGSCGRGLDQGNFDQDSGMGRYHGTRMNERFNKLSDEDQKKLDAERTAFWEATKDLKREIHRKQLEIQAELVGKDTDAKKTLALQKEFSALQSQLDLKRLEHWLRLKEIFPDGDVGPATFSHKGHRQGCRAFQGACR